MNSLGQVLNISAVDASNGDAAITSKVDGKLRLQAIHLFGLESSITEHSDLRGDMVPVVLGLVSVYQVILEGGSHGVDTLGHLFYFNVPKRGRRRR